MKHKFIAFLLLLALTASALTGGAVLAAGDPVDDFAAALGRFETTIQVPVRDFDALMQETFQRYPQLYFYYGGCSYLSVPDGLEIEMTYVNTDVPQDQIWAVENDDELMAALGLSLADKQTVANVVMTPGYNPSEEAVANVVARLTEDYYLLWMGLYSYMYSGQENQQWDIRWYRFELSYWEQADAATLSLWRDSTESALLQLSETLFAQDMPDYEKALIAHDYLVDSCRYDMADLTVMEWENHIAYGALAEGSCVCQGYAEAFKLLMEAAGVECITVTGEAGGGSHMWNCVQLGGQWYMMDLTWDDPVMDDGSDVKLYDYFNITSAQLAQDHQWDAAAAPDCTATDLNYETVRQLVDGDTASYTDYSSRLVRTQAIQIAELEALLAEPEAQEVLGDAEDQITDDTQQQEAEDGQQADDSQETDDSQQADDSQETDDSQQADDSQQTDDGQQPDDGQQTDDGTQPDDGSDADQGTEPEDDQDDLGLQLVVPLRDEEKQGEPMSPVTGLILALVLLGLGVGVVALILHCVANSRVQNARSQRKIQRDQRVANALSSRRRRF